MVNINQTSLHPVKLHHLPYALIMLQQALIAVACTMRLQRAQAKSDQQSSCSANALIHLVHEAKLGAALMQN